MEDKDTKDQKDGSAKENKKCNFFKKAIEKNFSTAEVIVLVIITLLIGLVIGKLLNNTIVISNGIKFSDKNVSKFINNYEYIINNYYKDIDKDKLIDSAISGMMESLDDPYSTYFDENEADNFNITLNGSYSGIGVQITKDKTSGYMLITSVFDNSPASKAGLIAGDYIVSINDISSKELSSEDFSSMVRKSNENIFLLKILRDEVELDVKLIKQNVELDSIMSKIYNIENKKIGYIYIGIFANNTYNQFKEKLQSLESSNIDGLIIDVRSNTGGHLKSVDSILDLFLNSKQIMYQFNQNDKITKIYGNGNDNKKYSIVLLGNEMSASASEVLISSLRENLNSKFVGKKTYGKGTVQEMVKLSDGTQYKLTVKKWLTPKGNWVNDAQGILPDVEIDLGEIYLKTRNEDDDSQLQTALNLFKQVD